MTELCPAGTKHRFPLVHICRLICPQTEVNCTLKCDPWWTWSLLSMASWGQADPQPWEGKVIESGPGSSGSGAGLGVGALGQIAVHHMQGSLKSLILTTCASMPLTADCLV